MDAPDLRLSNNVSEERATSDPLLNTCLEEKFQIVELLHDGLTARVYKAKHLTLDQFVVVKI